MKPKIKILILGGTEFVGRQLVEKLSIEKSNDVYLFNRGETNADLFPNIKRIKGDRETDDIKKIGQYKWDYVIDFSSYFPKSLQHTLEQINRDVKKYIYISTISVYSFQEYDSTFEIPEDFHKRNYKSEQLDEPSLKFYGEKKSACEDIINKNTWLDSIILRPSIIYGKYDPTDRLYYWIERIKKRNRIILPSNGEHQISLTYSDDLVQTIMHCLQGQLENGTYNCVSNKPMKFRKILETIKRMLKSKCEFEAMDSDKLKEAGLSANEFPFWFGGNLMIDNAKLNNALNIEYASLDKSLKSTIDYYKREGWQKPRIGITYEAEDKLIQELNGVPK